MSNIFSRYVKNIITFVMVTGVSYVPLKPENHIINPYTYYPEKKQIYVEFRESDEAFSNPYMGYMPWAAGMVEGYENLPDVSMAFAILRWKDFEPQKGIYDFDAFEEKNNFNYLRSRNIKIVIRIVCDYPSPEKHVDIPEWLYDETGGAGIYYNINGLAGFVPDYGNEYFLERHSLMIQALAERYDSSHDVAFIQLGSLGHWGEWHNSLLTGSAFPNSQISDLYIKHYLNAFKQVKMQMRRPNELTKENGMGLYNDMIGHSESTYLWLSWIKENEMDDYYKHAPSGGEFASTYSTDRYFRDMYQNVKKMIIDSHTTYIGYLPAKDETLKENINDLLKTIGYRFSVKYVQYENEVLSGGSASIRLCLQNKGIASFYYKWPIYYLIYDENGNLVSKVGLNTDIRDVLPGDENVSNVNINMSFPPGDYTVKLGIFNPITDEAEIRFANMETDESKLLVIGSINVK